MELTDRVVLVTGAARRVGRAIALELAARGARLALHYHRSAGEAARVADEITTLGGEAATFAADLRDPPAIDALVAAVQERFGGVDVLINSAADYFKSPLGSVKAESFDRLYALNLRAPLLLSQAVAPGMRSRAAGGRIIMITDVGGERPWPAFLPYGSTKAGLIYLTRGLAKALAPEVLVNAVSPGTVLPRDADDTELIRAEEERTLVGRLGEPGDVARAVAFLVESDFTTGQVLAVDGGKMWR